MSKQLKSKLIRSVMDFTVAGFLTLLIKTEKAVHLLEKKAKDYLSDHEA
jgi:hypothetical protein